MGVRKNKYFTPVELGQVAQMSCLLEVSIPKPGNVSPKRDFSDMRYEDFLFSASAIGYTIKSSKNMTVGKSILEAIKNTKKYVECNTNLGIILLLVPLTKAYYKLKKQCIEGKQLKNRDKLLKLRQELRNLLTTLTVEDATYTYEAIRLAEAGGLGEVRVGDIKNAPDITLKEAMRLSQRRDNIAREYVTDFEIIFNIGYPTFSENFFNTNDIRKSILQTFMTILAHIPDSLIARKTSKGESEKITIRAQKILSNGGIFSKNGQKSILQLEEDLSKKGNLYNPGTTADLTTAVIYTFILITGFNFFKIINSKCQGRARYSE